MRRLFLPGALQETVVLTGSDAHHVGYTLRAKAGDRFVVVGAGREVALMEVVGFSADTVTLHFLQRLAADTEPPLELGLAMCLPKADKMDFIVQKAVELGASYIQPLRSHHCVVRYDEKKAAARREKWQRIAAEAAKQCARTMIPAVEPILDFTDWLQGAGASRAAFMAYEKERQSSLRQWLQAQGGPSYVALIGPEGGFTEEEAAAAAVAGVQRVSLGPRILRAETAALAALTAVMYEKGDWEPK